MIKPALQDDAFLADVRAAPADRLNLWWLGQSGFLIQRHKKTNLLVDPYLSDSLTRKYAQTDKPHVRMSERVVDPAKLSFVRVVASTHCHTDHMDAETLHAVNPRRIITPRGAASVAKDRTGRASPILLAPLLSHGEEGLSVTAVSATHGDVETVGYVFQLDGYSIYHSGDTTTVDVPLLRVFKIDVAILPINGKLNNLNGREAANFAKDIGAKVVIPCHYDMFEFNTADPRELFVPECDRLGQRYRVLKLGERFTYPEDAR